MLRLLLVPALAFTLGVGLAHAPDSWPVRPGLIGLALMALAAAGVRHYWIGLGRRLAAPGSPERLLWLSFASTSLIAGHLFASLWRIGPQMARHSVATHALGLDNWTLVFGALVAWLIARDPDPRTDERDAQIAARGLRAGYWSLLLLLLPLILALGFAPRAAMEQLSQLMLAHLIISAIVLSTLAQDAVRLHAYWLDHRAERAAASADDQPLPHAEAR